VVGALPDDDLTDILGFDAFRALDEEALRICLNNYRKLPATASDVPPERHFWMLFLRLERWRSNGHFQIELGGEELLLEQLEGASEFTKFAQPQAGSASGGGGRAGSNSLSLSLVLDQSPQPCWVGTRDPPCAKRAVSLGGWGILDIRGVGASVSCGVMHDPPPSPPPPLLPPYAWLRPHPPPLPPPPAASGGSTAHSRGRGAASGTVLIESVVSVLGGLGAGLALAVVFVVRRRRAAQEHTRTAGSPKSSHRGKRRQKSGERTRRGRERVPTEDVEPVDDDDDDESDYDSVVPNKAPRRPID